MKITITSPHTASAWIPTPNPLPGGKGASGLVQISRRNGHTNSLNFQLPTADAPTDSCALRSRCAERAERGEKAGCSSGPKPSGCPFSAAGSVASSLVPSPMAGIIGRYIQQGLERDGRVLVEGPPASGKLTMLERQAGDAERFGCEQLTPYQLVGRYVAQGASIAFEPGRFASAVSSGRTVVLDDVGRLDRGTQKFIASVIKNGECPPTYCGLPHHDNDADSIPVEGHFKVHPQTRFTATFTPGQGQTLDPELEAAFHTQ